MGLRNIIKDQVVNVEVEQAERFVKKEAKLPKSILDSNSESKTGTRWGRGQGEGSKRVRTNFQIYHGFPNGAHIARRGI